MVSLLAAVSLGTCTWLVARRVVGGDATGDGRPGAMGRARRKIGASEGFQVWLSQAGAAVTPRQFCAVSAAVGAVGFIVLMAVSGTFVVAVLPAAALAATPYAYWSAQRRKHAAARSAAWPDALRYLVGVLGAGVATLHDALEELARSGPSPLRATISRYVRMSARVGDRQALEAVRAELADPVADPVLLAFEGAVEEGTETVLRVLSDLSAQITSDLQLAEKVRTLQTQSRAAVWGCFALPYVVLIFLCATNGSYREFFSKPFGLGLVLAGAALSVVGLVVCRRLLRPAATTERVFEATSWAQ